MIEKNKRRDKRIGFKRWVYLGRKMKVENGLYEMVKEC